ncbi:MAG: endonuclease III [Planctomycetota bacterium]
MSTVSRTPENPRGLRDLPFALPEVTDTAKRRAKRLLERLEEHYPDAHCELDFSNAHELLIATILSAQATDVGVNKATPKLFAAFKAPADYAAATPGDIEPYISSIGLFRNKAKSVHTAMTQIIDVFGGEVPRTMDELLTLRGVARKTAGVVLSEAFGIFDAFVVDTHVARFAERYGLVAPGTTVPMIERMMMALVPRPKWGRASHLIIWHGRRSCPARGGDGHHPVCAGFGQRCPCKEK